MLLTGILCGVLTALLQTASYFLSRAFLQKSGNAAVLLTVSQVLIALFSLAASPFVIPWRSLSCKILPAFFLASICFLIGQFFFFKAQKNIESSRIASLMGLKVVAVPLILTLFCGHFFSLPQWAAFLMAMIAAVLINYKGGTLFSLKGTGYILITISMYAASDIGVNMLIVQMPCGGYAAKAAAAALFNNIMLGIMLAPLIRVQHIRLALFPKALPYALCWGGGTMLIFACFSYLGPAFGNVVQALRGPFALLAGILLAGMGFNQLEERLSVKIWFFRALAALLMAGAILLYAWSKLPK